MANKSKIRSLRFSDDIFEMIERQPGENFSQKFDFLVTKCFYELPAKERELQRLDNEIDKKRKELRKYSDRFIGLSRSLALAEGYAENISKSLFVLDRDLSKM